MRFRFEQLDADTSVAIHEVDRADLEILADHCKAMHNAGAGNGKDEKLAMRADGFTILAWCNQRGVTWAEFFRDTKLQERFIEDPDNAAFRIWKGKL